MDVDRRAVWLAIGISVLILAAAVLFFVFQKGPLAGKATAAGTISLTSCTNTAGWVIGKTYVLANDVTAPTGANCFTPTKNNVVIDCAGKTIKGNNTGIGV